MIGLNFGFSPCEVFVNPLKDLLCLARPKFCINPDNWIAVAFVTIAAIYTMTKRDDVLRNGTGASWIGKRYPMISGKCMPQASGSTANGATVVEVIKAALPISGGEFVWKVLLTRLTTLFEYGFNQFVGLFALSSISLLSNSDFLGVCFLPLIALWNIRTPIGALIIPLCFSILLVILGFACLASSYMTISALRVFVKFINGFGYATFSASLDNHLRFSFANPCVVCCGQACKGLAVRVVHEATLAHSIIIPQEVAT